MYGASDFHIYPGVEEAAFIVACDVQNTILGNNGASRVYGPQKGATPEMVKELEKSLEDYVQAVETYFDQSFRGISGTGAAGGTAYGLVAFLRAEIKPGFEVLSEVVGLEDKIAQADIVITGEGKVDRQTQEGKVVHRIVALAKKHKKKVLVIGGQVDEGVEEQYDTNVHFYSLSVAAGSIDDAINNPEAALKKVISSLTPTLFE